MKNLKAFFLTAVGVLVLVYVAASAVFHYRHPWATDTEKQVWLWSALTFKKVPYEVMRPRGEKQ